MSTMFTVTDNDTPAKRQAVATLNSMLNASTPETIREMMLLLGPCEGAFVVRDALVALADLRRWAQEEQALKA